ncbi:hypothetical protein J4573_16520 [Actinomadura barringtoniae]|uniref:ATP/GTP-binding protein n=1 Tax=Actinomadura barringtoniae TaxID=1427535 RepID=A0A939PA86_9ACTN|nr:hypothetical protein [Actinomadura barringtoniae]MBO2448708.1 hypothetical protein [Actinomadura barringtoniae]
MVNRSRWAVAMVGVPGGLAFAHFFAHFRAHFFVHFFVQEGGAEVLNRRAARRFDALARGRQVLVGARFRLRPMATLPLWSSVERVRPPGRSWPSGLNLEASLAAASPGVVVAAVVLMAAWLAVSAVRGQLSSRALRNRVVLRLVPTEAFDPCLEDIRKVASAWQKARPAVLRGWAPRRAFPLRIKIHVIPGGLVAYDLVVPCHAEAVLRELGYAGVQIARQEETPPPPAIGEDPPPACPDGGSGGAQGRRSSARAELVLAGDDFLPLKDVPLQPDPLTSIYRALAQVGEGERAEVVVDLLPVTAAQARSRRSTLARRESRGGRLGRGSAEPWWRILLNADRATAPRGRRQPRGGLSLVDARASRRSVAAKLLSDDPMFALQVLIRAHSSAAGKAPAIVSSVTAAFAQFNGADNHLRAAGWNLGLAHVGSDVPGWRWWFDRRMDRGVFAPRYRRHRAGPWVTSSEIAGLLKPPTKYCIADNVLRLPAIPAPPKGLPAYDLDGDTTGLIPLGWIQTADGPQPVGVPRSDTLFTFAVGRAGAGKTEQEIGRFLALVRSGIGGAYLDFHDAAQRIRPYLIDQADRVIDIDLGRAHGRGGEQITWNPLDMSGRQVAHIERQVDAIVDAVGATLGWTQRNNRALTLLTMAAQSLCQLGLTLPADAQPTIFQIATILSNEDWRQAALPHLDAVTRDFFENRFPLLEREVTPVTNLIDRLRRSNSVAALLGASSSTFHLRTAMDEGRIVLLSFGGSGAKERLVAALFAQELFTAALSRMDVGEERRREFHAFLDEAQVLDHSGHLAEMFEQVRKFKLRVHVACQQPTRLSEETRGALLNNRSHLIAGTVETGAARLLARELLDQVTPAAISALDRYAAICSVTLHGTVSAPFLIRGFTVEELFGTPVHGDCIDGLDRASGTRPQSAADTLAAQETLDDRISAYLAAHRPTHRSESGPAQEVPSHGARTRHL